MRMGGRARGKVVGSAFSSQLGSPGPLLYVCNSCFYFSFFNFFFTLSKCIVPILILVKCKLQFFNPKIVMI